MAGQINGEYKAKEDKIKWYLYSVQSRIKFFDKVKFVQVPRIKNFEVDKVAKLASLNDSTTRPNSKM